MAFYHPDLDEFRKEYINKCKQFAVTPRDFFLNTLNEAVRSRHKMRTVPLNGNKKEMFEERLKSVELFPVTESLRITDVGITCVDVSYNDLDDSAAAALTRLLTNNTILKILALQGNKIGVIGLRAIAQALHNNHSLTFLNLNLNPLHDEAGEPLGEIIRSSDSLKELDIGNTDLGTHAMMHIAVAIRENKVLRVLNIENPRLFSLQEETTVHIARALQPRLSMLQSLYMGKHGMRDFGCATLCEFLTTNNTLTELDLRCNKITMEGARHLANMLAVNTTLKALNLEHNALKTQGALHIAKALKVNSSLIHLDMAGNNIGDDGLTAVAAALDGNRNIETLRLWGNNFGAVSSTAFLNLFQGSHGSGCAIVRKDFRPYAVDDKVFIAQQ